MSPRRRSPTTTTPDQPGPSVAEPDAGLPIEALKRRAQQRFRQALETYRGAVVAAAEGGGRIPDGSLDSVVEACQVVGVPVEQFEDDVRTVQEHRTQLEMVSRMESERDSVIAEASKLTKEIEQLEAELLAKKQRQHTAGKSFDQRLAEMMRDANDTEVRNPHLFLATERTTPELVRKKLTTRAFFSR